MVNPMSGKRTAPSANHCPLLVCEDGGTRMGGGKRGGPSCARASCTPVAAVIATASSPRLSQRLLIAPTAPTATLTMRRSITADVAGWRNFVARRSWLDRTGLLALYNFECCRTDTKSRVEAMTLNSIRTHGGPIWHNAEVRRRRAACT